MITVIKKIIIKEKEGKRQGKIMHVVETRSWDLWPRGLPGLHSAKSFYLNKSDVIFTVNTSKEV